MRHLIGVIALVIVIYIVTAVVPPPDAINNRSDWYVMDESGLLLDTSWQTGDGKRALDQTIFDAVMQLIGAANRIIVLDMFLFNHWQGPDPNLTRLLSSELTDALIDAKQRHPLMPIVLISDPVNTLYGGVLSTHFERLRNAGVNVLITPLVKLQDSNPVYSALWRGLVRPFGNKIGVQSLKAPFGDEQISVRSWLALLNFKANHRKLLITAMQGAGGVDRTVDDSRVDARTLDRRETLTWQAIVSSANPHDGSSAHRNVGLQFSGDAVLALLDTEQALLTMATTASDDATATSAQTALDALSEASTEITAQRANPVVDESTVDSFTAINVPFIRILTERSILLSVLDAIETAKEGDDVDVLMFYLSHREIVTALASAAQRGAKVRVMLDANKDAFGRSKNGVPNRPVAAELVDAGVEVRWCNTLGEQCHAKVIHTQHGDQQRLILGSANYTRRNLDNFNLETNVEIRVRGEAGVMTDFAGYFDDQWFNKDGRAYSLDYEAYAEHSWFNKLQYRFMEASGIGTF